MRLVIKRDMFEAVEKRQPGFWKKYGLSGMSSYWSSTTLNVGHYSPGRVQELREDCKRHEKVHGMGVVLKDLGVWAKAMTDAGGTKARRPKGFEPLLYKYIRESPAPWLYERVEDEEDTWVAYFVQHITFR